jgi:tetratricopeptide (TPR) repeat protein
LDRMKKLLFIIFLAIIAGGCSVMQPLQKRKLLSVFHLIETAKFAEAKTVAEELISDKESAQWPKTWYARGVLSQNAYREGIRRNDRKLSELYPDQLYVVLESFDKAYELDKRGRLEKQLAPKYILLANDFQVLGERHFRSNRFGDALKAFEQALLITEKPMLALRADTSLIYNTALAAFESKDWDKSIKYFGILHQGNHSSDVTRLLFSANLKKGDSIAAEKVLREGIAKFEDNQELVIQLADYYFSRNDTTSALIILDKSIKADPANHRYYYTQGLILQKSGFYEQAIESYTESVSLAPDHLIAYLNIATSYYNIGVGIDENARTIMDSAKVRKEREKSAEAYETAIAWLDKVYSREPKDPEILARLHEMYKLLRVADKAGNLERRF